MQGIILTGGKGVRLAPLTDNCNKHLIDICGRPMINYSLSIFLSAGINDITLVTNPHHLNDFKKAMSVGIGTQFNPLTMVPQTEKPGITGSILMMPHNLRIGPYMVVLGDNIIGGSARAYRDKFEENPEQAMILLAEVQSPESFGIAHIENGKITAIEEKPKTPNSHWAITGIYFFPKDLFDIASKVKPSGRGEYEVTNILNTYLEQGRLRYEMLKDWWIDAGTHESLAEVRSRICGEDIEEEVESKEGAP
ncbi:MAG: sugar phosphate nucleotidyltransferase [candidate division Zixibacteria bacterium]